VKCVVFLTSKCHSIDYHTTVRLTPPVDGKLSRNSVRVVFDRRLPASLGHSIVTSPTNGKCTSSPPTAVPHLKHCTETRRRCGSDTICAEIHRGGTTSALHPLRLLRTFRTQDVLELASSLAMSRNVPLKLSSLPPRCVSCPLTPSKDEG
jgi:hypothetical protein